ELLGNVVPATVELVPAAIEGLDRLFTRKLAEGALHLLHLLPEQVDVAVVALLGETVDHAGKALELGSALRRVLGVAAAAQRMFDLVAQCGELATQARGHLRAHFFAQRTQLVDHALISARRRAAGELIPAAFNGFIMRRITERAITVGTPATFTEFGRTPDPALQLVQGLIQLLERRARATTPACIYRIQIRAPVVHRHVRCRLADRISGAFPNLVLETPELAQAMLGQAPSPDESPMTNP